MTATLIGVIWVVGLGVVIIVAAALAAILLRRRSTGRRAADGPATPAAPPVDAPMTGLESALAQVSDRTGRPIREHIDAETQHVDDLRVPDDTGPLLRRALDHVERHDGAGTDASTPPSGDPA